MTHLDGRSRAAVAIAAAGMALGFSDRVSAQQADPSTSYPLSAYITQRDGRLDPQSISDNEALWGTFHVVATFEAKTPGLGAQVLQSVGLSSADAQALTRHIGAS